MRIATVLALVVSVMLLHTSAATAAAENSAEVHKDFFVGTNLPTLGLFLRTTDSHFVESASGNVSVTAHFDIPPGQPIPDKAQKVERISCWFFGIFTTDCSATIKPSGKVTLKAHVNPRN